MLAASNPAATTHATADSLEAAVRAFDETKFHFQKQINHWIGHQSNPAIEDDRTDKLDVRGLLLSNPKNMEAELKFHKELFSKLKFNFLEQTTKEMFLKRVLAQPPEWSSPQEIADTEKRIRDLKSHLKKYKKETETVRDSLSSLVDQVSDEYETLLRGRNRAFDLHQRIDPLNNEIAQMLCSFDPEQKTLPELIAINEELRERVQPLASELKTIESQLTASQAAKTQASAELAHFSAIAESLGVKVAEAKSLVHLRDPNLDGHLVWCQNWDSRLMQLEGIESFEAVDTNKLIINYNLALCRGDTTDMKYTLEIEIGGGEQTVDAKILNVKCDIQDIVKMANRNMYQLQNVGGYLADNRRAVARSSNNIGEVISMIAKEVRTRLSCLADRASEKKKLESIGDLHICWDDEAGLIEIGVVSNGQDTIIHVKIDGDYPRHWSCIEVIGVEPELEASCDASSIQNIIEENRINTITKLIHNVYPSIFHTQM
ncbi:hypothetical protein BDR26DRAFT_869352 [Obelidium mucronatum]|nr:hypothetical protein BDR26DRAFT_869352 [Obelidium mucronatum]